MNQKNSLGIDLCFKDLDNPIDLFGEWFKEAKKNEINDPNALALATADKSGIPTVRMVLMKNFSNEGFVFYTNFNSKKSFDLKENPNASMCFHWKSLLRQIRITGKISKVSDEDADEYYKSRSYGSRIGAWASKQSSKLKNREELLERIALMEKKFKSNPPRPAFWGGIRIRPLSIEFWKEGKFRLHERELWKRLDLDQKWSIDNLYP